MRSLAGSTRRRELCIRDSYYAFDTWEEFTALNEKPMGTGIMTFDSWAPKQFVKLNKNANYWDSANAAKIDGVLMSEVPDLSLIHI